MKNIKNIYYYLVLIIIGLFLPVGCTTDFLDEVHPTQTTNETFFTDDEEAEEAALGLYQYTYYMYGSKLDDFASAFDMLRGDDFTLPVNFYSNALVTWLTLNYNEETTEVEEAWTNSYKIIYRANWVIEGVTDNDAISDETKKYALSLAYFFRGFCYFNLTRLFEEVPLVLSTSDTYYPEKSSNDDCWAQVFSDFEEAISEGGLSNPTQNYVDGQINLGVIYSIMARAYLYRTRPGSDEYWDEVLEYTKKVEDLNTYELEDMTDFSRLFVYTSDGDWVENTEVIWAHGFLYGSVYSSSTFYYTNYGETDTYSYATSVCAPVGYCTVKLQNDAGDPYLIGNGMTGRSYYALSTDLSDIMLDYYSKGDKRTEEFLLYPTFNDYGLSDSDDNTSVYIKNTYDVDSLYSKVVATNGSEGEYIHMKKFQIREFVGTNIWDGGFLHPLMYPIIRYADVLLMRAEAEYHVGTEANAQEYLKKITDRAGFDSDYVSSFTGDALLDEILQQRRVELLFESLRVPDLIRLDEFDNSHVGTYTGSVAWDEKLSVLPIPRSELDLNPNLEQNDLWK